MVVRTVPITRGTSRPASASSAATKKKKNPEPPPAPPATSGTDGSGANGAAGATSRFTPRTRASTPTRPPGPPIGLCVRARPLPRAIVDHRAASLSQLVAGAELGRNAPRHRAPGTGGPSCPGSSDGRGRTGWLPRRRARSRPAAAGVVRATGAGCRPPLVGGREEIVAAAPPRCVLDCVPGCAGRDGSTARAPWRRRESGARGSGSRWRRCRSRGRGSGSRS